MKRDTIIGKNRTMKSYTTTIKGGTTQAGKNKMLKDHYTVLKGYRRDIKEIKQLGKKAKKLINLDELLKMLYRRKENIETKIKNLQLSKYSDKDNYNNIYTKESVLKLANEVLKEHEEFISEVEEANAKKGISL